MIPPPAKKFNQVYDGECGRLSAKQIECLNSSEALKRKLGSSELQSVIASVDSSDDRINALQRWISADEHFGLFVEEMLDVVKGEPHKKKARVAELTPEQQVGEIAKLVAV